MQKNLGRGILTPISPYLYVLPAVAFFVVFLAYPYVFAIWLSLHKWNGFTPLSQMAWVGFANYRNMLTDPYFGLMLKNTLLFGVGVTLIQNGLAFLLAFGLFHTVPKRLSSLLRGVFFYPVILSQVVVGLAWKDLLRREGFVNALLGLITGAPVTVSWFGSPHLAMWAIMAVAVWSWTGWTMVIYLAGLCAISPEVLDAAAIDGASTFRLVWHVILGVIRPVISLAVLLNFVSNIQTFALIFTTTYGGPLHSTEVMGTYSFWLAFASAGPQDMGYAATLSTLMTTALFGFALLRVRATRLV